MTLKTILENGMMVNTVLLASTCAIDIRMFLLMFLINQLMSLAESKSIKLINYLKLIVLSN